MRSLRLLYSGLTAGLLLLQGLSAASAAPLDELTAAARKEGTLNFYGPSTLIRTNSDKPLEAFSSVSQQGQEKTLRCEHVRSTLSFGDG